MNHAVRIENACVTYQHKGILHGISLEVVEGELLGLFGCNGAGKSTLLKTMNGLVRVRSGSIRVCGCDAAGSGLHRIRRDTAYVPQSLDIDPRMPVTALDVTLMGRYGNIGLLRRPGEKDYEAARNALELVEADHLAQRPFGRLSGGEQQRVLIARALAQEPRLLLLDEPTNSLDWEFQRRLGKIVCAVHKERELTTVVVSHNVDFLADICARIVIMENGRITGEKNASEFTHCCRSNSIFGHGGGQ